LYLGPFYFEIWHLILIGVGVLLLAWFMLGFLRPVTGTWERVDEDVQQGRVERITLVQFGPFVRGRRMMKGGFQEYSGYLTGRSVTIGRIDHGKAMIMSQGFPDAIAEEIDGTLTARMKLTLSRDGRAIFGTFTPQKIEFTHQPPKVTRRLFLEPSFRRYKLVSRQVLETEIVDESPPPGTPGSNKIRRTV